MAEVFINESQVLDFLLKRFHNKPFTHKDLEYFQEPPIFIRPYVLSNQIWLRDIPASAPSDLFAVTLDDLGGSIVNSTVGRTSTEHSHIRKYEKLELEYIPGGTDEMIAFKGPTIEGNYSILEQAIPFNFDQDANASYNYEIHKKLINGSYQEIAFGDGGYIIDSDSGIMTITEMTPNITAFEPPHITYYRYVGATGITVSENFDDIFDDLAQKLYSSGNGSNVTEIVPQYIKRFNVRSNVSGIYIDNTINKEINLIRGQRYYFNLINVSSSYPFYISASSTGGNDTHTLEYTNGVQGNGNANGSINEYLIFNVPDDAPGHLYYQTNTTTNFGAKIHIDGTILQDGDRDTKITVEQFDDEDQICFYTNGTIQMCIQDTGTITVASTLIANSIKADIITTNNSVINNGNLCINGTDSYIKLKSDTNGNTGEWLIGSNETNSLYIKDTNTDRNILAINSNDSDTIIIGNQSTPINLTVDGITTANVIETTHITATSDSGIHINTNNQSCISVIYNNCTDACAVGIGVPFPIYELEVNGTVYCEQLVTPSDCRFKKNIKKINNTTKNRSNILNEIKKIDGVSFEWDSANFNTTITNERPQLGFIAQQVEDIFPEIVYTDKKGYKAMAYDKMTAILVESVKELCNKVTYLETKMKIMNENDNQNRTEIEEYKNYNEIDRDKN
jgi:hypothetical protein